MELEIGAKYKFVCTNLKPVLSGIFILKSIEEGKLIGDSTFKGKQKKNIFFCFVSDVDSGEVRFEKIEKMPKSENRCVWW